MSRTFFGNIMISMQTSISATTLRSSKNQTTSPISANVSGGSGIYTYLWLSTGVGCTITNPTAATTRFTGSNNAGITNAYCIITDTITGNTSNTNTCTITWSGVPVTTIPITAMSFTLNGVPFTTDQTRSAGTIHNIEIISVTPSDATYAPISLARSTAGTSSLTSTGTGNYTGSFTSPVLTLI